MATYVTVDRDVVRLLETKPAAWRAVYLYMRIRANWHQNKPHPGLGKNCLLCSNPSMTQAGIDTETARRAVAWMAQVGIIACRKTWRGAIIEFQETTAAAGQDPLPPADPQESAPAETDIKPVLDLWTFQTGGLLMEARDHQRLSDCVRHFGHAKTMEALTAYLKKVQPQYCSVSNFIAHFGKWTKALAGRAVGGKHVYTSEFEHFWKIYPKKTGKQTAYKEFEKALAQGVTIEKIFGAASKLVAAIKQGTFNPQYAKQPEFWLKGGHWDDDLSTVQHPRGDHVSPPDYSDPFGGGTIIRPGGVK